MNINVSSANNTKFAIIGMDCKIPGADNVEEFWGNLCQGIESIGEINEERKIKIKKQMQALGADQNSDFKTGGYLKNISNFDNSFFGIINREAIAMPPAHRLFLEVGYHALEDAGYGGTALYGSKTGVFVGYIGDLDSQNYQKLIYYSKDKGTPTGALSSNLAGRFSYIFNFSGPSILVDTACSSSLTALNIACNSIMCSECKQALVGGVQIDLFPYTNENIGIESQSGHIRPFDKMSDGTVNGEGVIAILIKGYDDAIKDRDHIYAIIDAVNVNQDGKSIGLSAPNPIAQSSLITEAIAKSGKNLDDISYIEAHGTGTPLGDPIEMNVLASLFNNRKYEKKCVVGSVKANIGHLYAASGLAAVTKCCCMLKHKKIPPTINHEIINPKIKLKKSGLYINTELIDWDNSKGKRTCCISNFGFSGTNCHLILEEAEETANDNGQNEYYPFLISADSSKQLNDMIKKYIYILQKNKNLRYKDICFTALSGRKHEKFRLALNAESTSSLLNKLCNYKGVTNFNEEIFVGRMSSKNPKERKELEEACVRYCKAEKRNLEQKKIISRHLCELYISGILPEWKILFENTDAMRVSLPLYNFKSNIFELNY